jgi:hypothetical protein
MHRQFINKNKTQLCLTKHYAIKTYGAVVYPRFFTSAIVGGEWSISRPGPFTPWKNFPHYPSDGRLIEPQSRSGEEKKFWALPGIELDKKRRLILSSKFCPA